MVQWNTRYLLLIFCFLFFFQAELEEVNQEGAEMDDARSTIADVEQFLTKEA